MHGMSPHDEIDYWRERAKRAEAEVKAMRDSIVHACGLLDTRHDNARVIWAIRDTANRTSLPFSHERVQEAYDSLKPVRLAAMTAVCEAAIEWKRVADDPGAPVWEYTMKLDAAIDALVAQRKVGTP